MSNKDDDDFTRIEDLSEFVHDESDDDDILLQDDSSNEKNSFLEMEKESFGEATSFMELPSELNEEEASDFDTGDFESSDFGSEQTGEFELPSEDSFEPADNFSEQDDTSSGFDPDDSFENDQDFESNDFETNDFETEQSFEQNSFEEDQSFSDNDSINEQEVSDIQEDEPQIPSAGQKPLQESIIEQKPLYEAVPTSVKEPIKEKPIESLNQFGNNQAIGDLSIEGNPPYSIIIKNVKYSEDADDIMRFLKEFKIFKGEHLIDAKKSIERGRILIPRLSEYSAIFLCHKLRHLDIDISMGLTKQITDTSSYESIDSGLTSKANVYNNRSSNLDFNTKKLNLEDVQVTSLAAFENFSILKNIGVKSKTITIDNSLLTQNLIDSTMNSAEDELIISLKQLALENNCNGLTNVNISISPNKVDLNKSNITCVANIVRVSKKNA
ncbi:MAG: hypothetical protein N4A33_03490 [Bacteriovoracaceae bacterium]|nr:hypothetical protein [Bacteriovoracaceae bacterium]